MLYLKEELGVSQGTEITVYLATVGMGIPGAPIDMETTMTWNIDCSFCCCRQCGRRSQTFSICSLTQRIMMTCISGATAIPAQ